jgi:hypothetical protein
VGNRLDSFGSGQELGAEFCEHGLNKIISGLNKKLATFQEELYTLDLASKLLSYLYLSLFLFFTQIPLIHIRLQTKSTGQHTCDRQRTNNHHIDSVSQSIM